MNFRAIKGDSRKLKFKRQLRSNMTEPEKRLWSRLRLRQLNSLKFRRQHGIGPYIADFYCSCKSVAVELDGDTHGEHQQENKDKRKDAYLNSLGIRVVRYTNEEVMRNLEGVLEDLKQKLSS